MLPMHAMFLGREKFNVYRGVIRYSDLLIKKCFFSIIFEEDLMSHNRLSYDQCAYQTTLQQSVAPLSYYLDPVRYEHCNKCRMELGIVGGTAVSHVSGNLVDLENDLRNANRPNTHCPLYKFVPPTNNVLQGKEYIKPVVHPKINTSMLHLPACQMIDYKPVPLTPPMDIPRCSR